MTCEKSNQGVNQDRYFKKQLDSSSFARSIYGTAVQSFVSFRGVMLFYNVLDTLNSLIHLGFVLVTALFFSTYKEMCWDNSYGYFCDLADML